MKANEPAVDVSVTKLLMWLSQTSEVSEFSFFDQVWVERCDVASGGRDSRGPPSQRCWTVEGGTYANGPRCVYMYNDLYNLYINIFFIIYFMYF